MSVYRGLQPPEEAHLLPFGAVGLQLVVLPAVPLMATLWLRALLHHLDSAPASECCHSFVFVHF